MGRLRLKLATQPRGVVVIFFAQLFSFIGYAYIFSSLLLFSISEFHFDDHHAYELTGAFMALLNASGIFGGFVAGRYLGYRFAVSLGLLIASLALFILLVPDIVAMYWGLSFLIIAEGTMFPALFVLLGRLYKKNDPRRLLGFIAIYIGINIGAFLGQGSSGVIASLLGIRYGFLLGAIFMLVALFIFLSFHRIFGGTGFIGRVAEFRPEAVKRSRMTGACWLVVALPIIALLLHFAPVTHILLIFLGVVAILFVLKLSREEGYAYRRRLYAYILLVLISFCFIIFYMLIPSVITLFVQRNVNHVLGGVLLQTASFSALNPLFVIILGALVVIFWRPQRYAQFSERVPIKFTIGGFSMGLAYLALVVGIQMSPNDGLVNPWWVVLSYFFQSLSELLIIPVTFALIGDLVPARLEGILMGIWLFMIGVASSIAVFFTDLVQMPAHITVPYVTDDMYNEAFLIYAGVAIVIALISALLIPYTQSLIRTKPNQPRV